MRTVCVRAISLLAAAAVLLALTTTTSSARREAASLRVTPGSGYVGGQAMTFTGNIGAPGKRTIRLQFHMGRTGDAWTTIDGFRATTNADGSFEFVHPAPAMFGIQYRVAAGSLRTNGWEFESRSQDLTLQPTSTPVAGRPFEVEVDTTPELRRRPDTIGLQPIPGRTLTLQRRVDGDTWETLGTTSAGRDGMGYFTVTEDQPGTVVYRVRQEDWTQDGNRIGWFPSFPTYVEVADASDPNPEAPRAPLGPICPEDNTSSPATATAGSTHQWGQSLFDFAWEFGESLTSKPFRGTRKRGYWIDYTNGSGRVNRHNGGLMLDSKRDNSCGPGDFGTTRATLQGNPLTYGRWEVRLRLRSDERHQRDYRVLAELVPERASDYACGARNVTIAELTPHSSTVKYGVNAMSRQWNGQRSVGGDPNDRSLVFAVEVTKTHMSWFYAGKVIGTVKSRAASSDVPMTLRLSMVGGDQSEEMNHTALISDWQRGFTLDRGNLVTNGKRLAKSAYAAPDC